MSSYELQFARITNSGKLPDRFLTCQHHQSADLAKKNMGEIFVLVEMLSPWFPTAQVGQMIIANFVKYYYQGGSTSDLVNFENSLKGVNEDLAQITQNGETDWIGNLNSLLAIIIGNNLHLTSTGRTEAYIFRDGKINHLTANISGPVEPHPLKTFSNIISGEIKNQDKIVFANKELFDHLSLESIRQIISINNPQVAALQITKLLKKEKVRNVNLMIIGLGLKEELSGEPLVGKLENVFYLDKSTDSFLAKISFLLRGFLAPLGKIISSILSMIKGKISKTIPREKKKEAPPEKFDRFHQEFIAGEDRDDSLLKDEEIKYSPDFYIHHYNALNTEKERKSHEQNKFKMTRMFGLLWSKIISAISWIIATARDRKRRKILFIISAIVLIIIIGLVIVIRSRSAQTSNLEAQRILDVAIAAQKEGKSLLADGNQENAKEKFVFCLENSRKIQDKILVAKDAQEISKTCLAELDKLTATTRFVELKTLMTIPNNAKSFFVISGQIFMISESDIYEGNLVGGNPSKSASIPTNKGNFIAGARQDKILYLYTSGQNLFQFDTGTKKLETAKIVTNGRWETANAISSYVGSLYLLDGVLGQIYKHSSSQEEFNAGEEYISTVNVNLRDSVSLAIDGSVYVLKNNSKILKIQKSKLQDFSIKNIPTPSDSLAKPIKIYTDADTPSIYILDSSQKRIVEFDKDGQFVHQYALPENFDKIIDFVISIKSRKIWVLNNNSVYEISI